MAIPQSMASSAPRIADFSELYKTRFAALRKHCEASFKAIHQDNVPYCDSILNLCAAAAVERASLTASPARPGLPSSPRMSNADVRKASTQVSPDVIHALQAGGDVYFVGSINKPLPSLSEEAQRYGILLGFSVPHVAKKSLLSSQPKLSVEDESGSVQICEDSTVPSSALFNGAILACKGHFVGDEFFLTEVVPPRPATLRTPARLNGLQYKGNGDPFVLVISSLEIGGSRQIQKPLTCLTEWVSGRLPIPMFPDAAQVAHIIVAGNTVAAPEDTVAGKEQLQSSSAVNVMSAYAGLVSPLDDADRFLAMLSATAPTWIVPGLSDPTTVSLPQTPFPPIVFPYTARIDGSNFVTNPCIMGIGGLLTIIQDDTALKDVMAQIDVVEACKALGIQPPPDSSFDSPECAAAALEICLNLRHLCPAAPSSTDIEPLSDDPFVLRGSPGLWISGGHSGVASRKVSVRISKEFSTDDCIAQLHNAAEDAASMDALLLAAPSFSKTGQAVLVNMRTLETQTLSFGQPETMESSSQAVEDVLAVMVGNDITIQEQDDNEEEDGDE